MENYLDNIFIGIFDDDEDKFSPSFEDLNLRCINNSCEGREREILEALLINCYNKNNSCACQSGLCPQLTKYNNKVRFCPCERSECVVKEGGCPCTLGSVCRGRKSYADECIPAILCLMNTHFEVTMDVIHQHVCSGITELRNFCKKILNEFSSNCQDVLKKEQVEGFCGLIKDLHGMKRTDEDGQLLIEKEERSSLFAKPQNEESKIPADPKYCPTNLDLAILTNAGMQHMKQMLEHPVPRDFKFRSYNRQQIERYKMLYCRGTVAEILAVKFCLNMIKMRWIFLDHLGGAATSLHNFARAVIAYFNSDNGSNGRYINLMTIDLWIHCLWAWTEFRKWNCSVGVALTVGEGSGMEVLLVLEQSGSWSFIKGQMELDEMKYCVTAKREVREESGIEIDRKTNITSIGRFEHVEMYRHHLDEKPEYHNAADCVEVLAIK